MRDRFEAEVCRRHPQAIVNGEEAPRLPNTSNLTFPGADGEAILILLDQAGICVSPGSACGSAARNPSPVLTAMGLPSHWVKSSVRFSFSRENSEAEVDETLEQLDRALDRIASVLSADEGPVVRRS